jgi:hypothetical protein
MTRGGKREGAGRPLTAETPLKTRSIRMTDEEYIKIKEYLKTLRA